MPYSDGALGKSLGKISSELKNLTDDLVTSGATQGSDGRITALNANGGSSSAVTKSITQTSHGFSVGNLIRYNGTSWVASKADAAANADVDAIVSAVADANTFTALFYGDISGLSGYSAGNDYFLDPTTAGASTTTAPTTPGQVVVPVAKALGSTEVIFNPKLGIVVPAKQLITLPFVLIADSTALAVAEDFASFNFIVPSYLNGYTLVAGAPSGTTPTTTWVVKTASSSGTPTMGIRKGASTEMLSTALTIDINELTTDTAATPAVAAGAGAATVATGDVIHFDIDVAGTGTKGSTVHLTFQAP